MVNQIQRIFYCWFQNLVFGWSTACAEGVEDGKELNGSSLEILGGKKHNKPEQGYVMPSTSGVFILLKNLSKACFLCFLSKLMEKGKGNFSNYSFFNVFSLKQGKL